MYYAEAKGSYWQVIEHAAPVLAIPGLEVRTAHRECYPACKYDKAKPALDFLPNYEVAWLLAERLNLYGDMFRTELQKRPRLGDLSS